MGILLLAALAQDPEPLFRRMETGKPVEAMQATVQLARDWDDASLPRLERSLEVRPARALLLVAELKTAATGRLLLRQLPELLDAGDPDTARMALAAAGLRRLRGATPALLDRFEKLDEAAALRALGRIWTRGLDDPPLERRHEIDRLTVLALSHRLAMGASSTLDACATMLSVMTREELDGFLEKHAGDRFFARSHVDQAVRRRGFDPAKGARVHAALLRNPDLELVASILGSSPHALPRKAIAALLDDRRKVAGEDLLCDFAAARLSKEKLPEGRAGRDALIERLKKSP